MRLSLRLPSAATLVAYDERCACGTFPDGGHSQGRRLARFKPTGIYYLNVWLADAVTLRSRTGERCNSSHTR
jgi:hypothetical protein